MSLVQVSVVIVLLGLIFLSAVSIAADYRYREESLHKAKYKQYKKNSAK